MNTKMTKFLLPLAALALVSAACDPFPKKPGGDPAIVRVITYGDQLTYTGDSNTVETVTGGTTVSTDLAQPDDIIRIQFNKPMDGSTIQMYSQYDLNGNLVTPPGGANPCTPAANLDVSSLPAGTTVCYDPASATDGGQMVVTLPVDAAGNYTAVYAYGTTYTIGGTVKDYQGKSLTLHVSFTVDQRPLPYGVDGYTAGIDWFDSGVATSYEVLRSPTGVAGSYTSLFTVDPGVDCDGVICTVLDFEKVPRTDYYYQVTETTATGTITRPAALSPATTPGPLTPTLGVATYSADPTKPPTILTGIIRVAWGSVKNANGYDVDTSTDGSTWTPFTHYTGTARTVYYGTPAPGTTPPVANGTLTSGTEYFFRVTPTFASGFVAEPGNTGSKVAP